MYRGNNFILHNRYSGLFFFITIAIIPFAKAYYLLKSHSRNCEGIAVSQGVTALLNP